MAFSNNYPYTDYHELNLDWVIDKMKELDKSFDDFKAFNTITFKGTWSITNQYTAWSVVDNNNDGYLSIKVVPAGVDISNENYWVRVANYSAIFADFQNRLFNVERTLDTVTPEEFGAVGDGIYDDSTAIEAALATGKIVKFSNKTYNVTRKLTATNSIYGDRAVIKSSTETEDDYKFSFSNVNDIIVYGITFNSNLLSRGSLEFNNVNGVHVFNCKFTGYTAEYGYYRTDSQVIATNCKNVFINDCIFYDNGNQYGVETETLNRCISVQECTNVNVSSTIFDNFNQGIVSNSDNLMVNGCTFIGNHDNSLYLFKDGIITNNVFKDAYDEYVVIYGDNYTISNNEFIDGRNKIIGLAGNVKSLAVTNNTFATYNSSIVSKVLSFRESSYKCNVITFSDNIIDKADSTGSGWGEVLTVGNFDILNITANIFKFNANIDYARCIKGSSTYTDESNVIIDSNVFSNVGTASNVAAYEMTGSDVSCKNNTYLNVIDAETIGVRSTSGAAPTSANVYQNFTVGSMSKSKGIVLTGTWYSTEVSTIYVDTSAFKLGGIYYVVNTENWKVSVKYVDDTTISVMANVVNLRLVFKVLG